jgi:hypothetical protein
MRCRSLGVVAVCALLCVVVPVAEGSSGLQPGDVLCNRTCAFVCVCVCARAFVCVCVLVCVLVCVVVFG